MMLFCAFLPSIETLRTVTFHGHNALPKLGKLKDLFEVMVREEVSKTISGTDSE